MSTNARIWIVPDATDANLTYEKAGVALGDFILELDNNVLYVCHNSLLPIGVGSTSTATTSKTGTVKQMTHQAQLTSGAGTVAGGTVDVGSAFTQATLNNNFATLTGKINAILTALQSAGLSA